MKHILKEKEIKFWSDWLSMGSKYEELNIKVDRIISSAGNLSKNRQYINNAHIVLLI
jgi:hypothetical protein